MSAPECQMSDCEAASETACDHPDFGTVQVCGTCAKLFSEGCDE